MAQYYTLEEAARLLQTSQDEVKKLAEERKVRAFRDRGTVRFRATWMKVRILLNTSSRFSSVGAMKRSSWSFSARR